MIELLLQAERALEMGRVDAAELLYRQVATADPLNSIAVVGLARVTLERGDERAAYLEARRALEIDPENAAASRMAQRLEEVIRYRGGAVPEVADAAEARATAEAIVAVVPGAAVVAEAAARVAPAMSEADGTVRAPASSGITPSEVPVAPPTAAGPAPRARRSLIGRIVDRLLGRR